MKDLRISRGLCVVLLSFGSIMLIWADIKGFLNTTEGILLGIIVVLLWAYLFSSYLQRRSEIEYLQTINRAYEYGLWAALHDGNIEAACELRDKIKENATRLAELNG